MENKGRDLSYNSYEMGGQERNWRHNADDITGQPQMMRNDHLVNPPSRNSGQGTNYYQQMNSDGHANQFGNDTSFFQQMNSDGHANQFGNDASFFQQAGEGVKHTAQGAASMAKGAAVGAANIAQGAATAVKNTLGMNTDNTNNTATTTTNHPSNPSPWV